jgi:hypothetical protein|nr:MAG TPA: hypothetical protein [Bacteriophage sp.]
MAKNNAKIARNNVKIGDSTFSINDILKDNYSGPIREMIDNLTKVKHGFTLSESMTNTFKGPNIISNTPMLKPNTNLPGYVFTVRPDLNFSTANLRIERKMSPLLTDKANSIMRAIRCILAPQCMMPMHQAGFPNRAGRMPYLECPLVDKNYPFIAISDNNVKSLTGWPSGQLGIRSTPAGILKEVHLMADGPSTYKGEFSLNMSLNSMKGNPLMYLYYYWILYIGMVYTQSYGLMPWPEYLSNGRMDYTTRIYRLIMDETKTYVTEAAMTGYAIPRSIDIGPYFDYQADNYRPYIERTTEVEFACSGVEYLDEIIIKQFNRTVEIFQPLMGDKYRAKRLIKVDKKYQKIMNNKVYPWINPISRELEWWCTPSNWKASSNLIKLANISAAY